MVKAYGRGRWILEYGGMEFLIYETYTGYVWKCQTCGQYHSPEYSYSGRFSTVGAAVKSCKGHKCDKSSEATDKFHNKFSLRNFFRVK